MCCVMFVVCMVCVVLLCRYVVMTRSRLYCLYCVFVMCLRQSRVFWFLFFRCLCVSTAKLLSGFVGKGL
jgi:hypothetical protein